MGIIECGRHVFLTIDDIVKWKIGVTIEHNYDYNSIIIIIKEELFVNGGEGSEGYILDKCSRSRFHYYFTDAQCLAEELINPLYTTTLIDV